MEVAVGERMLSKRRDQSFFGLLPAPCQFDLCFLVGVGPLFDLLGADFSEVAKGRVLGWLLASRLLFNHCGD